MNERVDDVRRKLDVDVCSLYLAHPDRQTLEIVATSGLHRSVIGKQLGYAQGLTGKVARTRRPVVQTKTFFHRHIQEVHRAGRDLMAGLMALTSPDQA